MTAGEGGHDNVNVAQLIATLHYLERSIRRLQRDRNVALVLLCILSLTAVYVGSSVIFKIDKAELNRFKTNHLVTEQLFVQAPNGNGKCVISFLDNSGPLLASYDSKGNSRMILGLKSNGDPEIALFSSRGKPQLSIRSDSLGNDAIPTVTLHGSSLVKSLHFGVAPDDLPFISLADQEGRNRATVMISKDGKSVVQLTNSDGRRCIQLLTTSDGDPSVLRIIGENNNAYEVSK